MRRALTTLAALIAVPLLAPHDASDAVPIATLTRSDRAAALYVPDEVIVKLRPPGNYRTVEGILREIGGVQARRSAFEEERYLVGLERGQSVPETISRLGALPQVDYAEPNGIVHALTSAPTFTPNDPGFRFQWNFTMLDAPRTWAIQKGDPSVAVAVVDTGIAYEDYGPFSRAPDWGGTVFVTGYNVFTGDSHANDDNYHGTHVASTIAEATNNGTGVAGLAFGCALMPVKVLDSEGSGSFFGVAEGVRYATIFSVNGRRPVKVINLSLGGAASSRTLEDAIGAAVQAGIVVVAAAGNDSETRLSYPASLPNVVAVGAVDVRKELARYSNHNNDVVLAPGGDLARDDNGDGLPDGIVQQTFNPLAGYSAFGYFVLDGTSQATPHVAALAALLVRQGGGTDPAAVKRIIQLTSEDLGPAGPDDTYGWGLIRPSVALKGLGLGR